MTPEIAALYRRLGWALIPLGWPTPDGQCACGRGHHAWAVGKAPLVPWEALVAADDLALDGFAGAMTLMRPDRIENLLAGIALLERHERGEEPADALREALVARREQLNSASGAGRITTAAEVSA